MEPVFLPYEETQVTSTGANVSVCAPWLKIKGRMNDGLNFEAKALQDIKAVLGRDPQRFLSAIARYPFCYQLPRLQRDSQEIYKTSAELDLTSPGKLLMALVDVYGDDSHQQLPIPDLSAWEWDLESCMEFSRVADDSYDILALLSVLRRFSLLESLENSKGKEIDQLFQQRLRSQTDSAKSMVYDLVYQNYVVTRMAEDCLSAGRRTAAASLDRLDTFIAEERHHDRILLKALKSTENYDPKEDRSCSATHWIMHMLAFTGQVNFVAFAGLVDIFEKPTYNKKNSLMSYCETVGWNDTGAQLLKHDDINDDGDHDLVASQLMQSFYPICSYATGVQAIRLVELFMKIKHQMFTAPQTLAAFRVKAVWRGLVLSITLIMAPPTHDSKPFRELFLPFSSLNLSKSPDPPSFIHRAEENLYSRYNREIADIEKKVQQKKSHLPLVEKIKSISRITAEQNNRLFHQLQQAKSFPTTKNAAMIVDSIRQMILNHPVLGFTSPYSSYSKEGYCFGRALFAHRQLITRGVDPQSILKIFALGDFYVKKTFWKFHVATLVQDEQHRWWVVDTLLKKTYPLKQWAAKVRLMSIKKSSSHIRFYLADPKKLYPQPSSYSHQALNHPRVRAFYQDLTQTLY